MITVAFLCVEKYGNKTYCEESDNDAISNAAIKVDMKESYRVTKAAHVIACCLNTPQVTIAEY